MQRTFRRFTGLCGLLALVSAAAAMACLAALGARGSLLARHLVDVIIPQYTPRLGPLASVALWCFITSNLSLLGFGAGLDRLYGGRASKDDRWTIFVASRLLTVGVTVFLIVSLLSIGMAKGLAPVVRGAETVTDTLRGAAQTFMAFRNYAGALAGLLIGTASFGYGVAFLGEHRAWAIGAAVAGSLGVVGSFWPVAPTFSYLRTAGYMLFVVWAAAVGLWLLRKPLRLEDQGWSPDGSEVEGEG